MPDEIKVKLWMPVTKDPETGKLAAALSDTSLDRDDEAMGKELMFDWAKNDSLKALANHQNSMQTWVGGWKNLRNIEHKGHTALLADPWFFSKDANPLAAQIEKQIEEALEKGENAGISIGAIMHKSETRKIDGKEVKVYIKGELLEATWVPIQSNRNASYGHIAKQFGLNSTTNTEEKMTEITQKDIDDAVQGKTDSLNKEFEDKIKLIEADISKKLEVKDLEIKALTDEVSALKKTAEAFDSEKKVFEDKVKVFEEKVTGLEADVEKANKTAIDKQNFFNHTPEAKETSKKALEAGKIPIMRD